MPGVRVKVEVTEADQQSDWRKGMTGEEILEYVINRAFDNQGVPREGRMVEVSRGTIGIHLPEGWWLVDPETDNPLERLPCDLI